jgi:hypothetical protein
MEGAAGDAGGRRAARDAPSHGRITPAEPGSAEPAAGRAEVRAIAHSGTPAEVQRMVNAFLAALRAQPVVADAEYRVLELRPAGKESTGGYDQEFLVHFTMRER